MDQRISDTLRYASLLIVLLIGFIFVNKFYRRYQARNEIVAELQSSTSDASFYRQFKQADAEATLLRCIAALERADALGMPQGKVLDRVFNRKRSDSQRVHSFNDYPVREKLVRETLNTAHEAARQLGILDPASLRDLEDGRMPVPAGGQPEIVTVIDAELSPGLEKIVPNLELRPAGSDSKRVPTAIEIATARRLAKDLADAGLIEASVSKKILAHYLTPSPEPKSGEKGN